MCVPLQCAIVGALEYATEFVVCPGVPVCGSLAVVVSWCLLLWHIGCTSDELGFHVFMTLIMRRD